MTSAISPPRIDLADCSPKPPRTASHTFERQQPFARFSEGVNRGTKKARSRGASGRSKFRAQEIESGCDDDHNCPDPQTGARVASDLAVADSRPGQDRDNGENSEYWKDF